MIKAGEKVDWRTSIVARQSGSLTAGRSTSDSIGTVSERLPERRVLLGHLGVRRVWRPFDADLPQVAEGGLDGAGGAARGVKDIDLGAGDGGAVGEGPRAPGQRGEPPLGGRRSRRSGARIRPD